VAVGDRRADLNPKVKQIFFNDMICFCHKRFTESEAQKRSIGNWAEDGRRLRAAYDTCRRDCDAFRMRVRLIFGLRRVNP
jgi:hypothetical protein